MSDQASKLFQSVIWPAAAGNVAWSFFTVALEDGVTQATIPKLAVLGLLSIYLGADWLMTEKLASSRKLRPYFWIADGALAAAIVTFAIATQQMTLPEDHRWLTGSLVFVFAAAAVGHLFGAWEPVGHRNMRNRWILALANLSGGIVILLRMYVFPGTGTWHLPGAVLMTLICWAIARRWLV